MRRIIEWLRSLLRKSERGQSLIFAAVMGGTLMGITGLAVLGGHVFVEFRRMQAAADMAAIVGAQELPCGLTDTTCINKAEQTACNYAQSNGYGGGWSGSSSCAASTKTNGLGSGTITVTANVPPVSCSPYDFLDYGNNSSCPGRPATTENQYVFAEVQISEPITVPIFNLSFTLYAHAVAKQGTSTPTDFAVSVLDPTLPGAFTMGGTTNTIIVGDTMSNGSIVENGTSATEVSCDGSWFTAATQTVPGNLTSNLSGAPNFANAACTGGTNLKPASFFSQQPLIPDPYGSTPPPSSSNMPNCLPCKSDAWYYTWAGTNRTAGTWSPATGQAKITNGNSMELFPGIYEGGIDATGGTIYLNPGIYTLRGNFHTNGGVAMCIYGAPACDRLTTAIPTKSFNCSVASFNPPDTNYIDQNAWYYYCSPWGVWDTNLPRTDSTGYGPGLSLPTTPPTFTDGTNPTNTPLNGVTFYMQSGDFSMNGSAAEYAAFPDPCPGKAGNTFQAADGNTWGGSAQFTGNPLGEPSGVPASSSAGYYQYPAGSLAKSDSLSYSYQVAANGTSTTVYPSADLTLEGECNNGLLDWNGEFPLKPKGQHLHFLVFADNWATSITLNGTSAQNWFGILHTFPQNYSGYPGPPTVGCGNKLLCNITLDGTAGAQLGPPLLMGQSVSGTANFQGTSIVEIFYRPCRALTTPCGTGPGTALVE